MPADPGVFTVGSLFSGVGGLDLGLQRAGFRVEFQVEIDPFCRRVLAKHWPDVRRHDDVRSFPPGNPDEWRVDLVAGGFPCKQTSTIAAVHGRRSGLDGRDSGLWFAMLGAVERLRPRLVLVENVAGVSPWSDEIEGGLAAAGYRVSRCPLSAWDAGSPHLRRRMFFLADRDGSGLEVARIARPSAAEFAAWRAAHRDDWLSSLPRVLRVDDGLPGRLDRRARIQAVGNAVVPQMAEFLGRRILSSLSSQSEHRTHAG